MPALQQGIKNYQMQRHGALTKKCRFGRLSNGKHAKAIPSSAPTKPFPLPCFI
jgi:hypothetical protein